MFTLTTFRARVFWTLIPSFCVLFVLVAFIDLYQQKQLASDEVNRRARAMAENLAFSSRLAVLTEDKRLLEAALYSVTSSEDFAYVLIYGDKWRPLVQASGKSFRMKTLNAELETGQRQRLLHTGTLLVKSIVTENTRYIEYVAPIVLEQSNMPFELQLQRDDQTVAEGGRERLKTIGAVRLGLSLNRVDGHMASFLKWRAWSIILFLLLSALTIFIFSVRITRPINQLTSQARKMSQGLLDQAIPVESGDEIGQLASSFNDMAQSLKELYSGLERKVAERTEQLTTVNEKLAEASEHKSRFLANVNHELRTPLSSIIGYGRLLRRETEGQISSLQRENLDDLLRNAERLLGLIDSLLNFARIESGKMQIHLEPVQIDELIQAAATIIEPMLNKDKVRLVQVVPITMGPLYTDGEKLRQIVLNLLGNAVKFTDEGEIRISAYPENGNLKLAVTDTGIGIAEGDVNRIFDEFDRGRLVNDGNYHGTGLGLAIVKRLVEVLGGSISLQSEVGKGSTFTVILPNMQPGSPTVHVNT